MINQTGGEQVEEMKDIPECLSLRLIHTLIDRQMINALMLSTGAAGSPDDDTDNTYYADLRVRINRPSTRPIYTSAILVVLVGLLIRFLETLGTVKTSGCSQSLQQ